MVERVIPIVPQRGAQLRTPAVPTLTAPTGLLQDSRGRPLRDLRISVTDRCNFRCNYCMPQRGVRQRPRLFAAPRTAQF